MRLIIFSFVFTGILCFANCNKNDGDLVPINQATMFNCHNKQQWNETSVANALIGKWKWIYSESYWAPENGKSTESRNIILELFSDSTMTLTEDGTLNGGAKWIVGISDVDTYGIGLDTAITGLVRGRIFFCGNLLEFNDSYIDGSDNYFRRIEQGIASKTFLF